MKIQIKNRFSSTVLFEYKCKDNTIKITLEKAISEGADLYGANLVRANLVRANLYGANLVRANLEDANLYGANLYGANLEDANLVRANLEDANLENANLEDANLYNVLNKKQMSQTYIPMHSKYCPMIMGDKIKIGREEKTISAWDEWFKSKETYDTKRGTKEFKLIEAHYKAIRAYKKCIDK